MSWDEVFAFARERFGALGIHDGERFGVSADALRSRAEREGWPRPYRKAVLLPGADPTEFRTRVSAALRSIGGEVWAGRRTAAYLLGMIDRPPPRLELVVPHGRRATHRLDPKPWRTRNIYPFMVTEVDGLRATTAARTIMDAAAVLGVTPLQDLVIDGMRARPTLVKETRELVDWMRDRGHRVEYVRRLEIVLTRLERERPESALDRRTRQLLTPHGFDLHPRPFPFRCPDGVVIHLDIAIPWAWCAIECDGYGSHSGRRAFRTDRVRWSQAQRGGWRVTWVDTARLENDPDSIIEEVQEVLAEADPDRPPPQQAECRCPICVA